MLTQGAIQVSILTSLRALGDRAAATTQSNAQTAALANTHQPNSQAWCTDACDSMLAQAQLPNLDAAISAFL